MLLRNKLLKYITNSILAVLCVTHIIQVIETGIKLEQLLFPVFILIIIAIYKESRKLYSLFFLICGIGVILTISDLAHLGAVPLFFIAMLYYSKPIILCSIFVSIISAYALNFHFNPGNYINLIEGIIGNFAFLTFLYFAVINKPTHIAHLARITPLDARQLIILKYLSRDISRKEMPDKVPERELWKHDIDNFTFDIINAEISKIKKVLDLKSEFALGIWYSEKCEISRNTSKT